MGALERAGLGVFPAADVFGHPVADRGCGQVQRAEGSEFFPFLRAGDAGTYTPDRTNGSVHLLTVVGALDIATPSNMTAGQSLTLIVEQDNTGGHAVAGNINYY